MRHSTLVMLCLGSAMALSACQKAGETDVDRAIQSVNAIEDNDMSDVMLTVADPNEAVNYFKRTSAEHPDRIDLQRNLAKSLVRSKQNTEAAAAWGKVVAHSESTSEDKVDYADALIRAGNWEKAEAMLDSVPPTYETFDRYKLEAMIADGNKEWKKADSFYETAVGLTTRPSSTLNNWGYSKLTRGEYREAERLFGEAIQYDPKLFTAKNNLVLARGAQRNYQMPIVDMTQVERAQLLHTLALTAIKQGDVTMGRSLLQDAIDTHPQHFDAAVHSLNALDAAN
ncbi:tetratricopeptide repeat protein [Tropicimonas sediminicola]|uniref:Flp pilus assembly protein TadD, contains TPR repeats n=1 Tax=Tropicimonas sediminicola TaxID=1031541 RepID=A0A239KKZ3_9RHOB|nr:tetratricopeptide repeat protein [Tropicimonas sediminicola]SNT18372.1 Flp pilus assembly protein TadD, contains TPR repeats [Tropicimonas sediminicola]